MSVMPISGTFAAGSRQPGLLVKESTAPCTDMPFQLVTDLQGVRELERDWGDLERRMGSRSNPFLSYGWNWHWCEHFLSPRDSRSSLTPCILVGKDAGRVNMIWPLVLEQKFGMRILKFMGAPVSQYGDILAEDAPDLETRLGSAWDYLCDELMPDALHARKVRADSAIAALLRGRSSIAFDQTAAPYVDLSGVSDVQDFQTRFSKRFRRNTRRQANRLSEMGDVTFRVVEQSGLARGLVGRAIEMKTAWLRAHGHSYSALNDSRVRSFFERVVADTKRPSGVLVSVMSVGGRPAAIEIGVSSHGHYAAHIGTFDPDYASLSVGTIQMMRTVEHLINRGERSYDLMAPENDYKSKWADSSIQVADHVVPVSARGHMFATLYLKRLRPLLKSGIINVSSFTSKAMKLLKR